MYEQEDLSPSDIADIYTEAVCTNWSAGNVYSRLKEAAEDFGVDMDAWVYYAENNNMGNGIDH